jgi:hypothetical protein
MLPIRCSVVPYNCRQQALSGNNYPYAGFLFLSAAQADIDVLGDPARGAAKDFRAAYDCGGKVWVGYVEGEASDQPALLLTCEPRKPGAFKAP